ncbi:MAG: STAS domain-containing protein [Pirellulaceae bacterium]|jgi:anti-sigma B factor antagonist|nr:STAS domain-containing protein [Pirellulaceae bacterium]MDP7014739.1 STAS domain-containing protein [Pirellulaceae bacterium]
MSALRTSQAEEGVLVVNFTDAKILDEAKIQAIGKELMECVGNASDGKLLLDFTGVAFLSSAMIGKLVLVNKKCKSADIKVKFCNISDNVMEVFKITRLHKVFDIQKDSEKALKSFDKKGWFGG